MEIWHPLLYDSFSIAWQGSNHFRQSTIIASCTFLVTVLKPLYDFNLEKDEINRKTHNFLIIFIMLLNHFFVIFFLLFVLRCHDRWFFLANQRAVLLEIVKCSLCQKLMLCGRHAFWLISMFHWRHTIHFLLGLGYLNQDRFSSTIICQQNT